MVALLAEPKTLQSRPRAAEPRACPYGSCPEAEDPADCRCCRTCGELGGCRAECGQTLLRMCGGRS